MELNEVQRKFINDKLDSLSKSKFRSSFHLKNKDILYIKKVGMDNIYEHVSKFIDERLAPSYIENDGRQTPMRGHPCFIAQHATGTCCRGCLYKWHHIPPNKDLSDREKRFIKALIISWITKEFQENNY